MSLQPAPLASTIVIGAVLATAAATAQPANLVQNGSFETDADGDGVPDGWATAGHSDVQQELSLDTGRDGGTAARLDCTEFVPGTPSSHAMICQVGVVGAERGQWYRLSFWTKGTGIARRICQVALRNTDPWQDSGIDANFGVGPSWQHIEAVCQATADVPAETSRLQFWFGSTGSLWLDDVQLVPIDMQVQLHPQIAREGVRNVIPNSSFECGPAGWGSYAPNLTTWTGNVFRLIGETDETTAYHGESSLRIDLDVNDAPTFYFDYFDPIEQPLTTIVAAHHGWVPLTPGEPCTLSCYLRADRPGVPAVLMMHQSNGRNVSERVEVGTEWQRFAATFAPATRFGWAGVGPDLADSDIEAARVWVDAVQLEIAQGASEYAPRANIESLIRTPAAGNIFTDPAAGMTVDVHAWNGAETARTVRGELAITDFFETEVLTRPVECEVAAGGSTRVRIGGLLADRRGFYRVHWRPEGGSPAFPQDLRCALIDRYQGSNSAFGMNHAFGWDFLLRLCKAAGLHWMRDWSVKWHTVQPEKGAAFDFSIIDPQIDRVLAEDLNVLMLFPFPSSTWSSSPDMEIVREVVGEARAGHPRYTVCWRADDDALFKQYISRSTDHYASRIKYYEILNEPLCTTYALPERFGYEMEDYVEVLRLAHAAIKANDPDGQVVGGLGTWAGRHWVKDFVEAGGLQWCDAMDIHLYPVTTPPELYEEDIAGIWQLMKSRNEAKPIWLTEFGCYADDDPYRTPGGIGDAAMSRANWPSEQEASEALVKSSAVFLTHGVRKIFCHAGTCGPINGRSGANVFFEYGGAPRKMYPALASLAGLLGADFEPLSLQVTAEGLYAYPFRTATDIKCIVWAGDDGAMTLDLPDEIAARDIMGNPIDKPTIEVTSTPKYLVSEEVSPLQDLLEGIDGW